MSSPVLMIPIYTDIGFWTFLTVDVVLIQLSLTHGNARKRAKPNSPRNLHFNFTFKPKIKSTDADWVPTMYKEVPKNKSRSAMAVFSNPKHLSRQSTGLLEQRAPCSVCASRHENKLFKHSDPKVLVLVLVFVTYLNLRGRTTK